MKIWHRYIFFHLNKIFWFFLFSIFILYTLVDLSIHGIGFFSHGNTSFLNIATYYLYTFSSQLTFFFPLTFLIASLKVLLDLNTHHELVAFQMAGISKNKLLLPLFTFAFFLSFISYANQQWLSPQAMNSTYAFEKQHSKKKQKERKIPLFIAALQDKSELVYQEVQKETLFDVFWIKSHNEIWHIKSLNMGLIPPEGKWVDHFQRNKQHLFEKTENFKHHLFPEIALDDNVFLEAFVPFENRSLSTLFQQSFRPTNERKSVVSHLHYKLATPLLSFLILFLIAPFTLSFSRTKPLFLITAMSLFSFVGFMTLLEGMLILGENQVLAGPIAIWGPFLFVLSLRLVKKNTLRID